MWPCFTERGQSANIIQYDPIINSYDMAFFFYMFTPEKLWGSFVNSKYNIIMAPVR